ncbi:MAG: catalase [Lachnospira sp.]|nr:catalase [Lachnospira sp.]
MTLKKLLHNFNGHLHTVNSHRRLVRKYCFKLGLYRQGMMHDLSKYSPSEFIPGVKYYQDGHRSPNNAQREDEGVSKAWLHHKGRNKHHFEYWIDYDVDGNSTILAGMKMPVKYVAEMFCDRVAASRIYNKDKYKVSDPLDYYIKGLGHYIMHPETDELLHNLLKMLADKGEEYTFAYIKANVLKKKKTGRL